MHPGDKERLLGLIEDQRAELLKLDDVTTHFAMGAFYSLERVETLVKRLDATTSTCLIHCRQGTKED